MSTTDKSTASMSNSNMPTITQSPRAGRTHTVILNLVTGACIILFIIKSTAAAAASTLAFTHALANPNIPRYLPLTPHNIAHPSTMPVFDAPSIIHAHEKILFGFGPIAPPAPAPAPALAPATAPAAQQKPQEQEQQKTLLGIAGRRFHVPRSVTLDTVTPTTSTQTTLDTTTGNSIDQTHNNINISKRDTTEHPTHGISAPADDQEGTNNNNSPYPYPTPSKQAQPQPTQPHGLTSTNTPSPFDPETWMAEQTAQRNGHKQPAAPAPAPEAHGVEESSAAPKPFNPEEWMERETAEREGKKAPVEHRIQQGE